MTSAWERTTVRSCTRTDGNVDAPPGTWDCHARDLCAKTTLATMAGRVWSSLGAAISACALWGSTVTTANTVNSTLFLRTLLLN